MNPNFELMHAGHLPKGRIRAAVFDFDGTISTLRCGWEKVMSPMMVEMIGGGKRDDEELHRLVDQYIDSSAGIQTVYQMRWLAQQVREFGLNPEVHDAWWYKDEYNRRLMKSVDRRIGEIEAGTVDRADCLVKGSEKFLTALRENGIKLYLASGTDHGDVLHEAEVLGVRDCFDYIKGAPEREASCSKEAVIEMILGEEHLSGDSLLMVGDGKVEIALGAARKAFTLGAATDEVTRKGVNPVKRDRLIKAGADVIIGDFTVRDQILAWMGV